MPLSRRFQALTACAAAFILALTALAAPLIPEKASLPPPIRSLRNIKQLRIEIGQLPEAFRSAGMAADKIKDDWTTKLRDAGFEIVQSEEAPKLSLSAFIVLDDDVPDARGYVFYVALDQNVQVARLDNEALPLPTYTDFIVGVESETSMDAEIQSGVAKLLDNFTNRCAMASAEQ